MRELVAPRATAPPTVQRDLPWSLNPWSDDRSPERQAYDRAKRELDAFSAAGKKYPDVAPEVFLPSSGGKFRVQYLPDRRELSITVKCAFNFVEDGQLSIDPGELKRAQAERRQPAMTREMWTKEAQQEWKQKFFLAVNADWSHNFDYFCHRDWWESLRAVAVVKFYEVPGTEAGGPDLNVNVHKGWGCGGATFSAVAPWS